VYKYIEAASRLLGTGDTVHGVSHGAGTQQDTVVEQAGRKYTRGKLPRSEERSAQLISSKGPLLPCCIADSSVSTWGRRNYLEQRTGQGEHDGCNTDRCTYLLYSTVQLNNP